MPVLKLARLHFSPRPHLFSASNDDISNRMDALAEQTGAILDEALRGISPREVWRHLMATTVLALPFASGDERWAKFQSGVALRTTIPPGAIVTAYECASWGYILRYFLRNAREGQYLVCSIVDINVLDLSYWEKNEDDWGNSGFGVTTLVFELLASDTTPLATGTARKFAEFALAVREAANLRPSVPVALPNFPSTISSVFDRILPGVERLPDQYARWGHCFGSDAWILIGTSLMGGDISQAKRFLACTKAASGYWAIAEITADASCRVHIGALSDGR